MFRLYNSLSRKKEKFIPLVNNHVKIYVCGITPYDTTHLGHAFTYISFDVLIRYLRFKGYKVTYTQNVTDINDRDNDILERAKILNIPWNKLADFWTKKFLSDMKALNWTAPDYYLKASDQIPQVIEIIKRLLKRGLAYQINGSVYLDIAKYPEYGKLSKLNKAKMLRVSLDFEEDLDCPEKRNPLDITLWRASLPAQPSHIPGFNSPYGAGRPGWHIECSAMSTSTLGEQIDIHGGGLDLKFPHHEAEIAQSEGATGKIPFVKYWVHIGNVYYEGKKMSKSLGNMVMVSGLLKKYSFHSIRWLLLSHHYRKEWEFFEKDLEKASKEIAIIKNILNSHSGPRLQRLALHGGQVSRIDPHMKDLYLKEFTKALNNDLNTPEALNLLKKEALNMPQNQLLDFLRILGFSL